MLLCIFHAFLTCPICFAVYGSQKQLNRHMRDSHPHVSRVIKCHLCTYKVSSSTKYKMKSHMKSRHPGYLAWQTGVPSTVPYQPAKKPRPAPSATVTCPQPLFSIPYEKDITPIKTAPTPMPYDSPDCLKA